MDKSNDIHGLVLNERPQEVLDNAGNEYAQIITGDNGELIVRVPNPEAVEEKKIQEAYKQPSGFGHLTFSNFLLEHQWRIKHGFEHQLAVKDYRNEAEGQSIAGYLENVNMELFKAERVKLVDVRCSACGWSGRYFENAVCECLEVVEKI